MSKLAKQQAYGTKAAKVYKDGGAVKHDDEKMDRSLVKKMVKGSALTGKKCGCMAKKK